MALRPLNREAFVTDLIGCRGVIANTGFTFISEALHLGRKILTKPLTQQTEQESNALALRRLGLATVVQATVRRRHFDMGRTARSTAGQLPGRAGGRGGLDPSGPMARRGEALRYALVPGIDTGASRSLNPRVIVTGSCAAITRAIRMLRRRDPARLRSCPTRIRRRQEKCIVSHSATRAGLVSSSTFMVTLTLTRIWPDRSLASSNLTTARMRLPDLTGAANRTRSKP